MHLPSCPTLQEKYSYVRADKAFLYVFGISSTLLLLAGGALFATQSLGFLWYLAFVLFTAVYLCISYAIGIFAKPFNRSLHRSITQLFLPTGNRSFHFRGHPAIDVFLPSAGEPLEVIANTLYHVNRLNWDWTKLNVYVLDDSHRESIRELAERYAFHYIAREDRGVMKKAGNIRNAFKQTSGEYIVIFDADFCPRPEFLFETVPYFIVDPNTALVQTPQFFDVHKSMGWVERGAGSIQELFYRLIQVNRDHWQGSICVGTNAVYRRAALEPFGGTYPIQHSEDVHTGFSLVRSGWRLRYVPIVLAKGTCPEDMDAFFNQQYRWAMGSTSLLFNKALFWNTKLKPMTRMSYLSGMFYYSATGMGLLLTSLPGLCMVWLAPERIFYYNYLFSLPSFIFGVIIMGAWNRAPYGLAAVRARYVSYCAHLFAIVDRTFSRAMEWLPTGSVRRTSKPYRTAIIITTLAPAIAGAIGCVVNMGSVYNYHFYPYIFFTLFYTCLHLSCLIKPRYNSSNAQTTTVNNDGDSVMRHSRSA